MHDYIKHENRALNKNCPPFSTNGTQAIVYWVTEMSFLKFEKRKHN